MICKRDQVIVDGLLKSEFDGMVKSTSHAVNEPGAVEKMKEYGIVHHGVAVLNRKGAFVWTNATHKLTESDLRKAVEKALE